MENPEDFHRKAEASDEPSLPEEIAHLSDFVVPTVAISTPHARAEGVLRFLHLALALILLGMTINLIRLDYRMAEVEKKLAFVESGRGRDSPAPPQTALSPLPSNSTTERIAVKEATANDKFILGDNPIIKSHPLLPTPTIRPVRSGRNLKLSGKDATRLKTAFGSDRLRRTKKTANSQSVLTRRSGRR